jgi:hypothetical protein
VPEPQTVRVRSNERRRFRRVQLDLPGRYMRADGHEHPCRVRDISPGGLALETAAGAAVGERVVAYIDQLGRLEGVVVRTFPTGFAMTIEATARKRDMLAAQLTWLVSERRDDLPEGRRHARIVPRNPRSELVMPSGIRVTCRIIDLSQSGAAVASETKPPVGTVITLGKVQGRVTRVDEEGFAVEFTRLQHLDFLEENIAAA